MNIGFLYRLVHEKCVNYHEIKFLVASLFGICYVQIQNTIHVFIGQYVITFMKSLIDTVCKNIIFS